jgi:histidine ammonia-lyase
MIYLDGHSLTLEQIHRVACERETVTLTPEAETRILRCRQEVDRIIADNEVVYGINTGFGALKDIRIPPDKLRRLQRNLIISHSTGVGNYLPVEVVRGIMLLRVNSLATGYSGIRLSVLKTLIDMINKGVHPAVPEQGSVGASGDLAPISHVMLVLSRDEDDDREEWSGRAIAEEDRGHDTRHTRTVSGLQAMREAGIERVVLDAKEGLALINGTNVMTAIAALAVTDARILLGNAVQIFTASLESLRGVSDAFHAKIHALRNQSGQIEVARRIREYIRGSKLIDSRPGAVQDSYSLRCFPQVAGPIHSAIELAANLIESEANAVTDNPLIIPEESEDKRFLSGGNFHGEPVALASDFMKIAVAELGNISERRIFKLTSQFLNYGLPSMLSCDPGLQSGVMIMQYTAAALVSENKVLAHPASVDSIPTSEDVEDHVSMGTIAARQFRSILENVRTILAIEYIASCQALDLRLRTDPEFTGQTPEETFGPNTLRIWKKLREAGVDFWNEDRVAYLDVERAVALLKNTL